MAPYVLAFLCALAVDTIPVFAPPAWTLLLAIFLETRSDPVGLAACGAAGSTIGRYILSRYLPRALRRVFDRPANSNISYLGRKLGGRSLRAFSFVLLYSLTPLSTTALFTAAGAARVNPLPILPAFFLGKLVSDAVMIVSGAKAARGAAELWRRQASPKSLAAGLLGLAVVALMLFIDWRQLFERRRLRLRFAILKARARR